MEVEADAEHQEDDAELRKLPRQVYIADEPRGVRADQDARGR